MIILTKQLMEQLHYEAEEKYPAECCGILLGIRRSDKSRIVDRILPAWNGAETNLQSRHFLISPETIMQAECFALKNGCEIVGFYHSHPDCKAVASEYDARFAIPGYSYPIISVIQGKAKEILSFEINNIDEQKSFMKEKIESKN